MLSHVNDSHPFHCAALLLKSYSFFLLLLFPPLLPAPFPSDPMHCGSERVACSSLPPKTHILTAKGKDKRKAQSLFLADGF